MTRSHKIGWLVITVALLFALWRLPRLHGQGFGSFSHDQPFLAASAKTSDSGQIPNAWGVEHRWVASDLTNGTLTVWTDRVQNRFLTASNNSTVSKSSDYVTFPGGDNDVVTNGNANAVSSATNNFAVSFIVFYEGGWGYNQKAPIYRGLDTSFEVRFTDAYPDYWLEEAAGTMSYKLQTNVWMDLLFVVTNTVGHPNGYWHVYTNGVLSKSYSDQFPPRFRDIGPKNEYATHAFKGGIREIALYTNTSGIGFDSFATALHYYRTNTYGGSP